MNRQKKSKLDARTLGQLLLMQSILPSLPEETTIFQFICKGLTDIPGVAGVNYSDTPQETTDPNTVCFPLTIANHEHGHLLFQISDPSAFKPYVDYLKNFSFMVAVILEERRQRLTVEKRTQELRDAQDQLVRKEKLAVLGQLAGSVGHELRNPLGVIANAVYFLKMAQPDADEKTMEYLNIIEKHIHLTNMIIADLLDFTRIKSAERESVSVSNLVLQTLERFPAPESVQVTLDLPEDLPQVYVDPQHVIQILGNLTLNSCQSMAPQGGKLTISSRVQEEMACISVQDTGSGISPENMRKLFEPLFTTKLKGIGLGLVVSKKLIEANGGRIEVESELGQGSTFTVYLPVK